MGGGAEGEGEIMDENRRRKGYWAGRCSGGGGGGGLRWPDSLSFLFS